MGTSPILFSPPLPEKPKVTPPVSDTIARLSADESAQEAFTHTEFVATMQRASLEEQATLLGLYEGQLYGRFATYVKQNVAFFRDIEDEFTVPDKRETAYSSTQNTTAVATLAMLRLKVYLAPDQPYPSQNEPNRTDLEARLAEFEAFNDYAANAGLNQYALDYRDWSAELAAELSGPTL